MDYKACIVRIFVSDQARALRFYTETLGMGVRLEVPGWAELETGDCRLALEPVSADDEEGRQLVGRFVGVTLEVADLPHRYAALCERGVEFLGPPRVQPWGGSLAHLRDPDGNVLTLLGAGD